MRSQLTNRTSTIPGVLYSAEGQLDGHDAYLLAFDYRKVAISFGPNTVTLTISAAIELINHLAKAIDAAAEVAE